MSSHGCLNNGCRCAGLSEYAGCCSPACSLGEPSRLSAATCPCWHDPCVVGPFAPVADPAPPIDVGRT